MIVSRETLPKQFSVHCQEIAKADVVSTIQSTYENLTDLFKPIHKVLEMVVFRKTFCCSISLYQKLNYHAENK